MNQYDDKYEIRLASRNDIDAIMNFIDEKWAKGHVLSIDRSLFEYEFCEGDSVNFVLAINRERQSIDGVLGFLRCSNTDDGDRKAVWGSIWKTVNTEDALPFLGIELAKRVYPISGARYFIGNGANPRTSIRLRKLFFHSITVRLNQHYIYNTSLPSLHLADIKKPYEQNYLSEQHIKVKPIQCLDEFEGFIDLRDYPAIPYKDSWYVEKRFFRHPYYHYSLWGISGASAERAVVVAREVSYEGAKALRIVDYYGTQTLFSYTGSFWKDLMEDCSYEYIDFYEYGFDQDSISKAGFLMRKEGDVNIIPNYFEPFVKKNVDIWGHFEREGTRIFKADGDQDRPNILRRL